MSVANATTANGRIIIGESDSAAGLEAFVWTPQDGMRRLHDVLSTEYGLGRALDGWHLSSATDISDDGRVIVGYGIDPDGLAAGFVAVVPEPASLTMCLLAVATTVCMSGVKWLCSSGNGRH